MAIIQFSALDIHIARAYSELYLKLVEADIREAHGEAVGRPTLNGVPEYVYEALVRNLDDDQKAVDAEMEAERRADLEDS